MMCHHYPEVYSLRNVIAQFPSDPNALICFDIDETLIPTPEGLYHETELLDPESPTHIQALKKTHNFVIGFTAAQGRDPTVHQKDVIPDWRRAHLARLGITFDHSETHVLSYFPGGHTQAIFKHGILFSDQRNKGAILEEFLVACRWDISRIVLVDDVWTNLYSVQCVANKKKIPFHGFLFRRQQEPLTPAIPRPLENAGRELTKKSTCDDLIELLRRGEPAEH